ncbi:DUF4440 domain-containing protein [Haloarcula sp. 1CSR25-25]|uniref:DUF4440 domain-containing protein n=1 Tax=Haloarcula sp. 1CSR25-25 TaxID=2862545 RepID=UPI0028958FEE|nr:hypothetical protein [Haloarcula sp. 1CSR25-25]
MAEIWSHKDVVMVMTGGSGREACWDAVGGVFEGFVEELTSGTITRTDQLNRVTGDPAYELPNKSELATFAIEQIPHEDRAIKVYRKENGEWKHVHFHLDFNSGFSRKW